MNIRVLLVVINHVTTGWRVVQCKTAQECVRLLSSAMQHRHVGIHELNKRSSRSHCITEIYIDVVHYKDTTISTNNNSNSSNNNDQ